MKLSLIPLILTFPLFPNAAWGQIVPDNSQGQESTQIDQQGIITGGAQRGQNLFHSFEQFNVARNRAIFFANPANITNIFSRVTGRSPSRIHGTLGVQGAANLFLLNPNGIIFSPEATLKLQGSFTAATANTVQFRNGTSWKTTAPTSPNLTVRVPVGLGFSSNNAGIEVNDQGHQVGVRGEKFNAPTLPSSEPIPGLDLTPGQTIAFLGNGIVFEDGLVRAPSGHIEVGSVNSGVVTLDLFNQATPQFQYNSATNFADIQIRNRSLLSSSGAPGGSITLQGQNLIQTGASNLLISNFGDQPSGDLTITLTGGMDLSGINNPANLREGSLLFIPSITTQSLAQGDSGDINIDTQGNISIKNFFSVSANTFSSGESGNVIVDTQEALTIDSTPPIPNQPLPSTITTIANDKGSAGDILLRGKTLNLETGGTILSQSRSQGDTGNVTVQFTKAITVQGSFLLEPDSTENFFPSTIGTTSNVLGEAGTVTLETNHLTLKNSGRINATTNGLGNGGNILINATKITVDSPANSNENRFAQAQITSAAEISSPGLIELFNLPPRPQGNTGNITIVNNETLTLSNGGFININNEGIGDAGNVTIDGNLISLTNQAQITASTESGVGGNIEINANTLTGEGNSDILANAQQGAGGQITIQTEQTFGFTLRESLETRNIDQFRMNSINDIVAISASNPELSGTVNLEEQNLLPQFEIAPIALIPPLTDRPASCFDRRRILHFNLNNNSVTSSDQFSLPQWDLPQRPKNWQPGTPIEEGNQLIETEDGFNLVNCRGV